MGQHWQYVSHLLLLPWYREEILRNLPWTFLDRNIIPYNQTRARDTTSWYCTALFWTRPNTSYGPEPRVQSAEPRAQSTCRRDHPHMQCKTIFPNREKWYGDSCITTAVVQWGNRIWSQPSVYGAYREVGLQMNGVWWMLYVATSTHMRSQSI